MDLTHTHLRPHKPDCFCQRKNDNPIHKDNDNQAKNGEKSFSGEKKNFQNLIDFKQFIYLFLLLLYPFRLLKALILPKNNYRKNTYDCLNPQHSTYLIRFWIWLSWYTISSGTTQIQRKLTCCCSQLT